MADIVNLRLARKRKARKDDEDRATANRALHGMSKSARLKLAAERDRQAASLDGHLRERDDDGQN